MPNLCVLAHGNGHVLQPSIMAAICTHYLGRITKQRYKIIMDDILIFSTKEQHWQDLQNLFAVLIKYGLKISPHKCQLF